MSNSISQDMRYKLSLLNYARKFGISKASRKYNRSRSFIYFWLKRFDGSIDSLACRSRKPHSHPVQHSPSELELAVEKKCKKWKPYSSIAARYFYKLLDGGYTKEEFHLFK